MTDTVFLEQGIMSEVEIRKELIELQNEKRKEIDTITDDARYLHELLTAKKPARIKEVEGIIQKIIENIEKQYKTIARARKEEIPITPTMKTALYNELVVCKEIIAHLNDIPRMIEKLEELRKKIAVTMIELREMDYL